MLLQFHMLRNFQNKQKPKQNKYFKQSHRTHSKITLKLFQLIEITVQEYPVSFRLYFLWYFIIFQQILVGASLKKSQAFHLSTTFPVWKNAHTLKPNLFVLFRKVQ